MRFEIPRKPAKFPATRHRGRDLDGLAERTGVCGIGREERDRDRRFEGGHLPLHRLRDLVFCAETTRRRLPALERDLVTDEDASLILAGLSAVAHDRRVRAARSVDAVGLWMVGARRQAFDLAACSVRARRKISGSSLPLDSARRRIPSQAFRLK